MITVQDVTDYAGTSLVGAEWEFYPDKDKAVNDANRIINRLKLKVDTWNDDIKEAAILTALELSRGIDPDQVYEDSKVRSTAFAGVRTTYRDDLDNMNVRLGVTNITAWRLLLPYLDYEYCLSLSRV